MKQILLLFVLLVLSGASAQSSEFVGGGVTFETGSVAQFFERDDIGTFIPEPLFFELQAGDYNLFGPVGFREVIGIDLFYLDHLELGGDILIPILERPRIYLGAGAGLTAGAGTIFNVRGVAGVELGLLSHIAYFAELNPGYYIARGKEDFTAPTNGEAFSVTLRFGFNYHP